MAPSASGVVRDMWEGVDVIGLRPVDDDKCVPFAGKTHGLLRLRHNVVSVADLPELLWDVVWLGCFPSGGPPC